MRSMILLAEISDKIVTAGQTWTVMALLSMVVGAVGFASRSWAVLAIALPVSVVGCLFFLSYVEDPVFGDAVLREHGWSWFPGRIGASLLPTAAAVAAVLVSKRSRRDRRGFEVVGNQ